MVLLSLYFQYSASDFDDFCTDIRDNHMANTNCPFETKEGHCLFRLIFTQTDCAFMQKRALCAVGLPYQLLRMYQYRCAEIDPIICHVYKHLEPRPKCPVKLIFTSSSLNVEAFHSGLSTFFAHHICLSRLKR